MLNITAKKQEIKKESKSKHDIFVNSSKEFAKYVEVAKKIQTLNSEIKAYEAEVNPLYNNLKEEAIRDMEKRKNFFNFKWRPKSSDTTVTVMLADRYVGKVDGPIVEQLQSLGYEEDQFIEASYFVDNEAVINSPEVLADLQKLAEKWAKKDIFILKKQLKVKPKSLDKIRELKDSRLIEILRPLLSFRLGV